LLPRLDGMVDLAAEAGLYLLIDNHSECCGNQDVANDTVFWKAVAPRYKDRTLWTIENLIHLSDPLALVRSLPGIDYSNASVGVHPYATYRTRQKICDALGLTPYGREPRLQQLLTLIETLKSQYPTVMTELAPNEAGAPDSDFLMVMEKLGVSWAYLGGQGFRDAGSKTTYGWTKGDEIQIVWPRN
jgi:hypothetical protein